MLWGLGLDLLSCFVFWFGGVGCLHFCRIILGLLLFILLMVRYEDDCLFWSTCFLLKSVLGNFGFFLVSFQGFQWVLGQTVSYSPYCLQWSKVATANYWFYWPKPLLSSSYLILSIHLPKIHFPCPWHVPWVYFLLSWYHHRSSCRQP